MAARAGRRGFFHFGGRGLGYSGLTEMNFTHFMRVEREVGGRTRHTVVHVGDPKFSLELEPDEAAEDHIGKGVIRRLRLPNSWAGNYTQYAKFVAAAQEFFQQSFAEPAPKGETRRFQA